MTNEKRIKVVQCWDDGISDDIRLIEVLRKHGAKASFNLNIGSQPEHRTFAWKFNDIKEVFSLGRGELRSVYDGFLVANHGYVHPHLSRIPIADAIRCIQEGRDALEQHFGYPVLGFAYPFGDYNPDVSKAVHDAGHVYGRTVVSSEIVFPPLDASTFHPNCHFLADDFWPRFERAKEEGVFYFWGHSYELVTEEQWAAFDQKIARLTSNPAVEWTNLPDLFV